MRKKLQKKRMVYGIFPKRDQDYILINKKKSTGRIKFLASVTDGWTDQDKIRLEKIGKQAARFTAFRYPQLFLRDKGTDLKERARKSAYLLDQEFIRKFPTQTASVGVFLFEQEEKNIIVAVGSIWVFIWKKGVWEELQEIGKYDLDLKKYPSDVSRFFGRKDLKKDSLYSCEPDVAIRDKDKPIILATDGLTKGIFTKKSFLLMANKWEKKRPKKLIEAVKITIGIGSQEDDTSILVKY